jgi:hypothetical protein
MESFITLHMLMWRRERMWEFHGMREEFHPPETPLVQLSSFQSRQFCSWNLHWDWSNNASESLRWDQETQVDQKSLRTIFSVPLKIIIRFPWKSVEFKIKDFYATMITGLNPVLFLVSQWKIKSISWLINFNYFCAPLILLQTISLQVDGRDFGWLLSHWAIGPLGTGNGQAVWDTVDQHSIRFKL